MRVSQNRQRDFYSWLALSFLGGTLGAFVQLRAFISEDLTPKLSKDNVAVGWARHCVRHSPNTKLVFVVVYIGIMFSPCPEMRASGDTIVSAPWSRYE